MSGKPKIPEWQRAATSDNPSSTPPSAVEKKGEEKAEEEEDEVQQLVQAPTPTEEDIPSSESEEARQPPSELPVEEEERPQGLDLLEQAQRFLEDPAIRGAPREKKAAFLESKGVRPEHVESLLGATPHENNSVALEDVGQRALSTAPPQPVETSQAPPQPRVLPPIVTYPEFLATNEKPPPLMTTARLVTTAYVTGGLMASIYGLSNYIIAPMTENLAESRHDFAQHTQEQLKRLNEQLAKAVSVDPASKAKIIKDVADDVSEADSDPTELYHRDYGTQTTPTLSRRPSASNTTDPQPLVTAHENRLKIIKSHLQELKSNRESSRTSQDSLRTKVSELSTYLSEMSYQNQYYSNMGFYGSPNYGVNGSKDGKNDQIEAVKGDIRAVKGVFLSARNFPVGGNNTSQMPMGRADA
ncbi:hypothetical protein J1614_004496 [Plenodomus biglobosus]|nr:hypothetical protein J1614_004496 [Plenodomus biglobosus]